MSMADFSRSGQHSHRPISFAPQPCRPPCMPPRPTHCSCPPCSARRQLLRLFNHSAKQLLKMDYSGSSRRCTLRSTTLRSTTQQLIELLNPRQCELKPELPVWSLSVTQWRLVATAVVRRKRDCSGTAVCGRSAPRVGRLWHRCARTRYGALLAALEGATE